MIIPSITNIGIHNFQIQEFYLNRHVWILIGKYSSERKLKYNNNNISARRQNVTINLSNCLCTAVQKRKLFGIMTFFIFITHSWNSFYLKDCYQAFYFKDLYNILLWISERHVNLIFYFFKVFMLIRNIKL